MDAQAIAHRLDGAERLSNFRTNTHRVSAMVISAFIIVVLATF